MNFDVKTNTERCKQVTEQLLPLVKNGAEKAVKEIEGSFDESIVNSVDMEFVEHLAQLKHLS